MAVLEGVANFVDLTRRDVRLDSPARSRSFDAWSLRTVADCTGVVLALAAVGLSGANLAYAVVTLAGFGIGGNYRRRLSLSVLDDFARIVTPAAIGLFAVGLAAPFTTLPETLFVQAPLTAGALVLGRICSYAAIRSARRGGRLVEPTLIIGAGQIGVDLFRQLSEHPEYGLAPVGVLDDVPAEEELPLLGSVADLDRVVALYGVRRIIVAFGPTGEQDMVATLRSAALLDLEVHVVPRFFELGLAPTGPDVEQIWGVPVYRVRRAALREAAWKVKRAIDVVVSGTMLAVLAVPMALMALAVRLSSPGPVLFRQMRVGQHGRLIEVLKYRTMRVNVDSDITWSVEADPRLTGVGRWLRRLSLDELPQLINVLRGDMSLVGPRPERPHFVNTFSAQIVRYSDRHRLPVGLTGLAQVHGLRGDTSIEERARFDNSYIEHWSVWHDIKIVLRTFGAVCRDAINVARRRGDAGERDEQAAVLRASGTLPDAAVRELEEMTR